MSIPLTDDQHEAFNLLVEKLLRDNKNGLVSSKNIVGFLGHIFAAAATDNSSEVLECLSELRYEAWLSKCKESPQVKKQWGKVLPI